LQATFVAGHIHILPIYWVFFMSQPSYSYLILLLHQPLQAENHILFARRVSEAKAARTEAEAQLRALFYLDALDAGVEEVLATYDFHAALARAAAQVW
jgi:hypothetical protein